MFVIKRDGRRVPVLFDKITERLEKLCDADELFKLSIDPVQVTQKVCGQFASGMSTSELDLLAADTAEYMSTNDPEFDSLATRILISNLHKTTNSSFTKTCEKSAKYINPATGKQVSLLSDDFLKFILANRAALDKAIDTSRDYNYDFFGFKTLERAYLMKNDAVIVERPQYMWMRVACQIHLNSVEKALTTYNLMSQGYFTHATPTLFNSGTPNPQLASCFLLTVKEDSIEGIYDTLKDCAKISKFGGGVGISTHKVRAAGSYIAGTNGTANGLIPMLRVFNNTARYVDQGGGKRKGAFAIYLEPWHADVFEWLSLPKNTGSREHRASDLFYGLWTPDLFMKRVEEDGNWALFCPHEAPGLADVWGEEFEKLYTKYEQTGLKFIEKIDAQGKTVEIKSKTGKVRKIVKARELWRAILDTQLETGKPYMLYKDACNRKSNQQHSGTIRQSNLCTEIIQYASPTEVAVCNLVSLRLPASVTPSKKDQTKKEFNFQKLREVVHVVTENLNNVIDCSYYPVKEAKTSNMRHRPIGIGVQGLADTFILMEMPFESKEAQQLNTLIFETIYFAALEKSCELAEISGVYESYMGSPASKGILQYDMWNVTPSALWDWKSLKVKIKKYGLRNSLLVAPMPTASTSQILGSNECFEPFTSNLYLRRTNAGEFIKINKYLVKRLQQKKLWSLEMKNKLILHKGSVQQIDEIDPFTKKLFKTVWEMNGRVLLKMAADRGAFIDQSQSLNVHIKNANQSKLYAMHMMGWKLGLKTGSYYLRTQAAVDAIQFTVPSTEEKIYYSPKKRGRNKVIEKNTHVKKRRSKVDDVGITQIQEESQQTSHKKKKVRTAMPKNSKEYKEEEEERQKSKSIRPEKTTKLEEHSDDESNQKAIKAIACSLRAAQSGKNDCEACGS